jgi:hypothetical protein
MSTDTKTLHVDYFVAFLRRNRFAHCTDALVNKLLPLMNESQLLSSIASAIGMLDASRRGTCVSYAKVESPRFLAFKSYSCSMKSLSTAILDPTVSLRDDVLWATLFLGLFEVRLVFRWQSNTHELTWARSSWLTHPEMAGQNTCYTEHLDCCGPQARVRRFLIPAGPSSRCFAFSKRTGQSYTEKARYYRALTGPMSFQYTNSDI